MTVVNKRNEQLIGKATRKVKTSRDELLKRKNTHQAKIKTYEAQISELEAHIKVIDHILKTRVADV